MNIENVKEILKKYDAEHLIQFYDELNDAEKSNLISQIENIDFDYMKELFENKKGFDAGNNEITNIPAIDKNKLADNHFEILGIEEIKKGHLAVCSMAGGQRY